MLHYVRGICHNFGNINILTCDAVSGTLRSNLDPFGLHDDARLWDALKRSHLVEDTKDLSSGKAEEAGVSGDGDEKDQRETGATSPDNPRFTLDSPIEDEGSNLSIGQRSLVSLARALVKDSQILILDEATASVDYETDRKIQDTIATEFRDRTILCIARTSLVYSFLVISLTTKPSVDRLRTIMSYDRICVMDNGNIAEFDTPEALYAQNGIFRAMCEHSSITQEDIGRGRKENMAREEIEIS